MSYFVTRIELNNHDEGDYEKLHTTLQDISFYRIKQGEGGKWHILPTGEYIRISDNTLDQINNLIVATMNAFIAKNPINKRFLRKDYEYILSKSEDVRFKLKD